MKSLAHWLSQVQLAPASATAYFSSSEAELEELFKQKHFHFVNSLYVKEKIERLVDKDYLEPGKFCQIPLGQEPRIYGKLKKIKYTNLYLFKALILDPNHLIYEETKFSKLKNLTCLFSEKDCPETRKKNKKR